MSSLNKHNKFVDPKMVSRNQVERLMERLKSHVVKGEEPNGLNLSPMKKKGGTVTNMNVEKKDPLENAAPLSNIMNDENSSDTVLENLIL
jgi:hypothetical protein